MDVADQPTPEPEAPAAERLPAGVLCYQCKYDLVGRVPGQPCPECGLDVAASWPVWDLRECHRVYVEQLRLEAVHMRRVAAVLALALGLVLLGVAAFVVEATFAERVRIAIFLPILGGTALLFWPVFLVQLDRVVRRRPRLRIGEGDERSGADDKTRQGLRAGAWAAVVGVVAGATVALPTLLGLQPLAALVAYVGLLAICIGVAALMLNIGEFRGQIIERTGRPRPSSLAQSLLVLPWAALPLGPGLLGASEVFGIVMLVGLFLGLLGSAVGMAWLATNAIRQANTLVARSA